MERNSIGSSAWGTFCVGIIMLFSVTQLVNGKSRKIDADIAYFREKKEMLTAVWNTPFSYKEIESRHAPKGPFLGNGNVGIVTYTSEKGQTLLISKVDFVTDNWRAG